MKKFLKIFVIVLAVLLVALFTLPYLFKDKILAVAKREMNARLNANADFSNLDLSFFRSFPRLSVRLESLRITGNGSFAKDTLIAAKNIDVAVNLLSLFNPENIRIYSIALDEPRIHALVDKQGRTNWDIVKPDSSAVTESADTSTSDFHLDLNHYSISNGFIEYNDEPSAMYARIEGLNHEGSGDLSASEFTLSTKTKTDAVQFNYGGVPYLNGIAVNLDGDFEINSGTSTYTFNKTSIALNDLKVNSNGIFKIVNDSTYNMDIKFDAPAADFKSILSLVPAIYKNDFSTIKTGGTAMFNGFVKGDYSPQQIPAYQVALEVKDGFFQYPDLPGNIKNINLAMKVDNPDGITDHTVVNLSRGHLEMDNAPFDFTLLLKNPMTNQYIDATAKGSLDLSQVIRYVKLSKDTKLKGKLNADVAAKGDVAVISQQKPGVFSAKGFIDIADLFYSSDSFPQPIKNTSAKILIESADGVTDNIEVKIPVAHVEIGNDKADLTLLLNHLASDPVFSGTAKGGFDLANVKQFYSFEPGTSVSGNLAADISFSGKKSFIDKEQYDKVNLAGNLNGKSIQYRTAEYKDGVVFDNAVLSFNPATVTINEVKGSFEKTDFTAKGSFDNLIGYALKDEPLAGKLQLTAGTIDLNKWMGTTSEPATSTAGTATSEEPFAVPANIRFAVDAKAAKLIYDKVEYKDLTASLLIKDQAVELKNVSMNGLDGSISMSGLYSTKDNPLKPVIGLTYDVKNLDVQKTFAAFNTVQALMPAAKFIAGKLSSKLTLNGSLGKDMMPDLSSLTGNGNLLILEGFLSKFAPVEKLASALNVKQLENFSLRDVKTYFAVSNGKVLVKPFTIKVEGIEMEIGGLHGLDQSLDYIVNLKIPTSMVGDKGVALANNLASQATTRGFNVKLSETVPFHVNIGGTITNPQLKVDLKETTASLAADLKKQTQDFVQAAIDSTKKETRDTLNAVKNDLMNTAKEELAKQLLGAKDSTDKKNTAGDSKKRVEDAGKGLLKSLTKKKKPADSTNR